MLWNGTQHTGEEVMEKKVSIIVPVYNAEKYLGYTISSIRRQTYKNIEIILVNDGSADGSLQICGNYAAIDPRIRVIDLPNGGVSAARNRGLAEASGEYVQFVDADDVIAENMTMRLVTVMDNYQADLAVCGMKYLQMEDDHIIRNDDWTIGFMGKECILDRNTFFEHFSKILLQTILLEGPCNKLYKRNFITEQNIRFPEYTDLGEDFIFNLDYFKKLGHIVFIFDMLYYYLQWNKESLNKCFRENLFENQVMLLTEYEKFLKEENVWRKENKVYFYQYALGQVIRCIRTIDNQRNDLTEPEIRKGLYKIFMHEKTALWIRKAEWISEDFEWLKKCIEYTDVGYADEMLKNLRRNPDRSMDQEKLVYYPGKINMAVSFLLRKVNQVLDSDWIKEIVCSLAQNGLKVTLKHLKNEKVSQKI